MKSFRKQLKQLLSAVDKIGLPGAMLVGLEECSTLEDLFCWIREGGGQFGSIDLIAQDEFSHDLILECPDTGSYLAFGST
ncbi:hypothetical protein GC174_08520 [bacterium]|nr:hypothetical protein [bacterium]